MRGEFIPFADNTFGYLNSYTAFGFDEYIGRPGLCDVLINFGPLWITSVWTQLVGLYLFNSWTESNYFTQTSIHPDVCTTPILGKFIFAVVILICSSMFLNNDTLTGYLVYAY